jgi:hypothetical protein
MKVLSAKFSVLSVVILIATAGFAQEPKKAVQPVEFPKLERFAALWERSIFTTKDLPSPDAPSGPNFADNLSLSGIYEIDGAVVAVLVDRTTSQVMEARIGSENEMGIKIRQVTPGSSVDKTRIQLQRGDQAGWVTFADAAAAQPAEVIQRAVVPAQSPGQVMPSTPPPATHAIPPQRRTMNAAPVRAGPPVNPILPPPSTPIPAAPVNDVPLPPP